MKKFIWLMAALVIAISGVALVGCGGKYDNLSLSLSPIIGESSQCYAFKNDDGVCYGCVVMQGESIDIDAVVSGAKKGFNYSSLFSSTKGYVTILDSTEKVNNGVRKTIRADYPGEEILVVRTAEGKGTEKVTFTIKIIEKVKAIDFVDNSIGLEVGSKLDLDTNLISLTPESANELAYYDEVVKSRDSATAEAIVKALHLKKLTFSETQSQITVATGTKTIKANAVYEYATEDSDRYLYADSMAPEMTVTGLACTNVTVNSDYIYSDHDQVGSASTYNFGSTDKVINATGCDTLVTNYAPYNSVKLEVKATSAQALDLVYDKYNEGTNKYFNIQKQINKSGNVYTWTITISAVNNIPKETYPNGYPFAMKVVYSDYDVVAKTITDYVKTMFYPQNIDVYGGSTLSITEPASSDPAQEYDLTIYSIDQMDSSYVRVHAQNETSVDNDNNGFAVLAFRNGTEIDITNPGTAGSSVVSMYTKSPAVAYVENKDATGYKKITDSTTLYFKLNNPAVGDDYTVRIMPYVYLARYQSIVAGGVDASEQREYDAILSNSLLINLQYVVTISEISDANIYNIETLGDVALSDANDIFDGRTEALSIAYPVTAPVVFEIDRPAYVGQTTNSYYVWVNTAVASNRSTIVVTSSNQNVIKAVKVAEGVYKLLPQSVGNSTITISSANLTSADSRTFDICVYDPITDFDLQASGDSIGKQTVKDGQVCPDKIYVQRGGHIDLDYVVYPGTAVLDATSGFEVNITSKNDALANEVTYIGNNQISVSRNASIHSEDGDPYYSVEIKIQGYKTSNVLTKTFVIYPYDTVSDFEISADKSVLYNPDNLGYNKKDSDSKVEIDVTAQGTILDNKVNYSIIYNGNSLDKSIAGNEITYYAVASDNSHINLFTFNTESKYLTLISNSCIEYPNLIHVVVDLKDVAGKESVRRLTLTLNDPVKVQSLTIENVEDDELYFTSIESAKDVVITLNPDRETIHDKGLMIVQAAMVGNDIQVVGNYKVEDLENTTQNNLLATTLAIQPVADKYGQFLLFIIPCDNIKNITSATRFEDKFEFFDNAINKLITISVANGTSIAPYQIRTASEFGQIAEAKSAYYVLKNSFSLYNYAPITEFAGNISGRTMKIANGINGVVTTYVQHTITINSFDTTSDKLGIFASSSGAAEINNMSVIYSNVNINASDITVGGIVAENEGKVNDCTSTYNNLIVYASSNVDFGGIVGSNIGQVINSHVTGSVALYTASGSVGGVVANNTGTITGSYDESATPQVTFGDLGFDVAMNISVNSTSHTANTFIGGVAGKNDGTGVISKTNTSGKIIATNCDNVGGLVGINNYSMNNSYSTMQVTGYEYVGGAVGQMGTTATLDKVSAENYKLTGKTRTFVTGHSHVGGLVGNEEGLAASNITGPCQVISYYTNNTYADIVGTGISTPTNNSGVYSTVDGKVVYKNIRIDGTTYGAITDDDISLAIGIITDSVISADNLNPNIINSSTREIVGNIVHSQEVGGDYKVDSIVLYYRNTTDGLAIAELDKLNTYSLVDILNISVDPLTVKTSILSARSTNNNVVRVNSNGTIVLAGEGKAVLSIYPQISDDYAVNLTIYVRYGLNNFALYDSSNLDKSNKIKNNSIVTLYKNKDTSIYVGSSYKLGGVDYRQISTYDLKFYSTTDPSNNFLVDGKLFANYGMSYTLTRMKNNIHVLSGLVKTSEDIVINVVPVIKVDSYTVELSSYAVSFKVKVLEGVDRIIYTNNTSTITMRQRSTAVVDVRAYTDDENDNVTIYNLTGKKGNVTLTADELALLTVSSPSTSSVVRSGENVEYVHKEFTFNYTGVATVKEPITYTFDFKVQSNGLIVSQQFSLVVEPQELTYVDYAFFSQHKLTASGVKDNNEEESDLIYVGQQGGGLLEIYTYPDFAYYDYIEISANSKVDISAYQLSGEGYSPLSSDYYDTIGVNAKRIYKSAAIYDNEVINSVVTYRQKYLVHLIADSNITELTPIVFTVQYYRNGEKVTGLDNTFTLYATSYPKVEMDFADSQVKVGGYNYLPVGTKNELAFTITNATVSDLKFTVPVQTGEIENLDILNLFTPYEENGKFYISVPTLDELKAVSSSVTTLDSILGKDLVINARMTKIVNGRLIDETTQLHFRVSLYNVTNISVKDVVGGILQGKTYTQLLLGVKADAYYNDSIIYDGKKIASHIKELEDSIATKDIWGINVNDTYINLSTTNNSEKTAISNYINGVFDVKTSVATSQKYLLGKQVNVAKDLWMNVGLRYNGGEFEYCAESTGAGAIVPDVSFEQQFAVKFDLRSDLINAEPIYSSEQFSDMMQDATKHYILMNDIILSDYTPIDASFGSFNGNGKTIYITGFAEEFLTSTEAISVGLFGTISESTKIMNTTVYYTEGAEYTYGDATSDVSTQDTYEFVVKYPSLTVTDGTLASEHITATPEGRTPRPIEHISFDSSKYTYNGIDHVTSDVSEVRITCYVNTHRTGSTTGIEYIYYKILEVGQDNNITTDWYSISETIDDMPASDEEIKSIDSAHKLNDNSLILNYMSATSVNFGGLAVINNGVITNASVQGRVKVRITETTDNETNNAGMVLENNGFVTNSWVENFEISSFGDIAGFVGTNNNKISSCAFDNSKIINLSEIIAITNYGNAGFVNTNGADGIIYGCYARGAKADTDTSIVYTDKGMVVSGQATGFVYNNEGTVTNSYSNIKISSASSSSGFVFNSIRNSLIENCYSVSSIKENDSSASAFTGISTESGTEVVYAGQINNCYFLQKNYKIFANEPAKSITAEQFASINTFSTFNIDYNEKGSTSDSYGYVWKMQSGCPQLVDMLTRIHTSKVLSSIQKEYNNLLNFSRRYKYYSDMNVEAIVTLGTSAGSNQTIASVEVDGNTYTTTDTTVRSIEYYASGVIKAFICNNIRYSAQLTFTTSDDKELVVVLGSKIEDGATKEILLSALYEGKDIDLEDITPVYDGNNIASFEYKVISNQIYHYYETGDNEGSITNPYIIYDVESYNYYIETYMVVDDNNEEVYGNDKHFVIISDIDFTSEFITSPDKIFAGYIDGNNMSMDNIDIIFNEGIYSYANDSFGVFATLRGAIIKDLNINLVSVQTTSHSFVGGLAGLVENNGTDGTQLNNINVTSTGVVIGVNLVGGVVGYATGDFRFYNIYGSTTVNSTYTIETDAYGRTYLFGKEQMVVNGGAFSYTVNKVEYTITFTGDSWEASYHKVKGDSTPIVADEGEVTNNTFIFHPNVYDSITFVRIDGNWYVDHSTEVSYAGGLFGALDGSDYTGHYDIVHVQNAYVSGKSTVIGRTAGGVIGYVGADTDIRNINLEITTGQFVQASLYGGGLVGENRGNISIGEISYSKNIQADIDNANNSIARPYDGANITFFSSPVMVANYISTSAIGGVVGLNIGGKLDHINSSLDVRNTRANIAGGLVGRMIGGKIEEAVVTGSIKAYKIMGGAIGVVNTYAKANDNSSAGIFRNASVDTSSGVFNATSAALKLEVIALNKVVAANNWTANYVDSSGKTVSDFNYLSPIQTVDRVAAALVGAVYYAPDIGTDLAQECIDTMIDIEKTKAINSLYKTVPSSGTTLQYYTMPLAYLEDSDYVLDGINTPSGNNDQYNSYPSRSIYSLQGVDTYNHYQMYTGIENKGNKIELGPEYIMNIIGESDKIDYVNKYVQVIFDKADVFKTGENHVIYNGKIYEYNHMSTTGYVYANAETSSTITLTRAGDDAPATKAIIEFNQPIYASVDGNTSNGNVNYKGTTYTYNTTTGVYANATKETTIIIEVDGSAVKSKNVYPIKYNYNATVANSTVIYKGITFGYDSTNSGANQYVYSYSGLNCKIKLSILLNKVTSISIENPLTDDIVTYKESAYSDLIGNGTYWSIDEESFYANNVADIQKVPTLNKYIGVQNWIDFAKAVTITNTTYNITTPEELAWVAQQVNNRENFSGKTIKLTSDIDLSGRYWTPIGLDGQTFNGTFDGNGHSIKYATVNAKGHSGTVYSYAGLFGYITGSGTIRNLTTIDGNIEGEVAGGIVGQVGGDESLRFKVINCNNYNTVTGNKVGGGIVGYSNYIELSESIINNGIIRLEATSDYTNPPRVGGIAGGLINHYLERATIINNGAISVSHGYANRSGGEIDDALYAGGVFGWLNTGSVNATNTTITNNGDINVNTISSSPYVGGVIGLSDVAIYYASNSGDIYVRNLNSNTTIVRTVNIGGVVGNATKSISRSKNLGDITYINEQTTNMSIAGIGGVVGIMTGNAIIVDESNNVGDIYTTNNSIKNATVIGGGIAGISIVSGSNDTITNCYNHGDIVGSKDGTYIGGLFGSVVENNHIGANVDTTKLSLTNNYNIGKVKTFNTYGRSAWGGLFALSNNIGSYLSIINNGTKYYIGRDTEAASNYYLASATKLMGYCKDNDGLHEITAFDNGTLFNSEGLTSYEIKNSALSSAGGILNIDTWEQLLPTWYPTLIENKNELSWNKFADKLTISKTIEIGSPEELAYVSNLVNNGVETTGLVFRLTANIDLANKYFTPIGSSEVNSFKGTFDGNGYTILNLSVDCNIASSQDGLAGLFGYTKDATLTNIRLESIKIVGAKVAGGIVAVMNGGSLTNSYIDSAYVSGATEPDDYKSTISLYQVPSSDAYSNNIAGGLVGKSIGNVSISKSYNKADINGYYINGTNYYSTNNVGAFVGKVSSGNLTITDCYNMGNVVSMGASGSIIPPVNFYVIGTIDATANVTYKNILSSNDICNSTASKFVIYNANTEELTSSADTSYTSYFNEWEDAEAWSLSEYTFNGLLPTLRGVAPNWADIEAKEIIPIATTILIEEVDVNCSMYEINNVEELAWVMININNGSLQTSKETVFIINKSINLGSRYWTPIGKDSLHPFRGTLLFNADRLISPGTTDTNPMINNMIIDSDRFVYAGLLGIANEATIKMGKYRDISIITENLQYSISGSSGTKTIANNIAVSGYINVMNDTAVGSAFAGAIVGQANNTQMDGLVASVNIRAKSTVGNMYVGGIVGGSYATNKIYNINNCFSIAGNQNLLLKDSKDPDVYYNLIAHTTAGNSYVGGISGISMGRYNVSSEIESSGIKNCISYMRLLSDASSSEEEELTSDALIAYAGGISGYLAENMNILECSVLSDDLGLDETSYVNARGSYRQIVGGIVGYARSILIQNCYNEASVDNASGQNSSAYIGGIAGTISAVKFYSNVNKGEVKARYVANVSKGEIIGNIEIASALGISSFAYTQGDTQCKSIYLKEGDAVGYYYTPDYIDGATDKIKIWIVKYVDGNNNYSDSFRTKESFIINVIANNFAMNVQKLDTPLLTISGNIASWTPITGATKYVAEVNGATRDITLAEGSQYRLTPGQTIKIKAIGNGDTIIDSEWSNTVTYNAPT